MAERRMFAKSVVLDDKFLDLTMATRCLYYMLGMEADDDGFVGAPKRVMRACGAGKTALNALIEAGYLHQFDSGVVAITHWTTNNQIRRDRYRPTVYIKEKELLILSDILVDPV